MQIYIYIVVFGLAIVFFILLLPQQNNVKTHIVDGYTILEIDNILTWEECDELINHCTVSKMENSEVVSKNGNILDDHRKSKTLWLDDSEHRVAMKMSETSAALTKLPRKNQEKLQVVCYESGGKFDAHYDNDYNTEVSSRCCTLLVYLNDDYAGGETEFVKIGVTIKPKKGKGILFWSLDGDNKIIDNSIHQGCTVKNGKKWICTKWTHVNPTLHG